MVHECMDEKFGQNLLNSSSVEITANMITCTCYLCLEPLNEVMVNSTECKSESLPFV